MYHTRPFGGNPKLHNPPKIYQRTPGTGTSGKRGILQSKAMLHHLCPGMYCYCSSSYHFHLNNRNIQDKNQIVVFSRKHQYTDKLNTYNIYLQARKCTSSKDLLRVTI